MRTSKNNTLRRSARPLSSQLLRERLKRDGWTIPDEAKFHRLYPGHWQRCAGAWVWTIKGGGCDIGSSDTVKVCLKADRLVPYICGGIMVKRDRLDKAKAKGIKA
jgi:hypothetical protein